MLRRTPSRQLTDRQLMMEMRNDIARLRVLIEILVAEVRALPPRRG
jgi:hypothetical protein